MIVGNPRESGADLAVALVNTWDTYDDPPEHLVGLDDLRAFLVAVGRDRAAERATSRDLVELKRFRDRLRVVFETDDVAEAADVLNELAEASGSSPHLERRDGAWVQRYRSSKGSVTGEIGAPAVAALIEVVNAHGVSRFGLCDAAPCTGAFVDRTKNRSKRYCCELCADRAAQQHHRARLRG